MSFDRMATATPVGDGRFAWEVGEGWLQGRTLFGGLVTAAAARAATAGDGPPVRSVTTRFVGPLSPGSSAIDVDVVRAGRSVVTTRATVRGDGDVAAVVDLVQAASRPSAIAIPAPAMPDGPGPDQGARIPYVAGVYPEFTQHIAMVWAGGGVPFSGSREPWIDGWCRFLDGPATGIGAVMGLLDLWPAPVLSWSTRPFPASTVQWTAHLSGEHDVDGTAWHRFRSRAVAAGDGYATFRADLWTADGVHVAWMDQLVAVYDAR